MQVRTMVTMAVVVAVHGATFAESMAPGTLDWGWMRACGALHAGGSTAPCGERDQGDHPAQEEWHSAAPMPATMAAVSESVARHVRVMTSPIPGDDHAQFPMAWSEVPARSLLTFRNRGKSQKGVQNIGRCALQRGNAVRSQMPLEFRLGFGILNPYGCD
jgi:hypothetical protein